MRNRILFASAACCVLLTAQNAQAAPPRSAEGTFLVESIVPSSFEEIGEISLIELVAVFRLDGTFEGTLTSDFRILHFGPLDEPAPELFFAVGRFEGSVDGTSGSLTYVFFGDIDAEGNAVGRLVILGGSGGLADLAGVITLDGVTGVGGVYSGWIH